VFLKLLERWPSHAELATAGRDEIAAFARANKRGWPDRFADRIVAAPAQPRPPVPPELSYAYSVCAAHAPPEASSPGWARTDEGWSCSLSRAARTSSAWGMRRAA
jgi:hypothetical protein